MKKKMMSASTLVAVLAITVIWTANTWADPLPGRDILKFSQLPMDGTPIVTGTDGTVTPFFGHDELSTAYSEFTSGPTGAPVATGRYIGQFMADDFADNFNTPVVHVKWWGSYLNNEAREAVDKFLISFETDIPDTDNDPHGGPDFSKPGIPLLNQIVTEGPLFPGSGTFTEKPISPGGPPLGEELYEYNAELHLGKEFFQDNDTVYWLKIVALVDIDPIVDPFQDQNVPKWGWHNRDYTIPNPLASPLVVPGEHLDNPFVDPGYPAPVWHFQDDAVDGFVAVDLSNDPIMPEVIQDVGSPQHYIDGVDGPGPGFSLSGPHDGIGRFSKDLAFELFTIPEPSSLVLLTLGLVGLVTSRKR